MPGILRLFLATCLSRCGGGEDHHGPGGAPSGALTDPRRLHLAYARTSKEVLSLDEKGSLHTPRRAGQPLRRTG